MEDKATIEGLLFMAGEEGLSVLQIQSVLQHLSSKEITDILASLKEDCQGRGIDLYEFAGRYKYLAREEIYPYGQKLFEQIKTVPLSAAAMETLAIIAYKQPVTRVEIEEIRGVGCDVMLKKLQARNLIQVSGHLDAVGKPLLYTVTDEFLDAFELTSLAELPVLEEKKEQEDLFAQS